MKQWTTKQLRITFGFLMMYNFLSLIYCLYMLTQITTINSVIFFFQVFGMPPLVVIFLTYFLLTKVYPPEEKKKEVDIMEYSLKKED